MILRLTLNLNLTLNPIMINLSQRRRERQDILIKPLCGLRISARQKITNELDQTEH